ncbi:tRNA (guanosine(37)-N1)-methyltransferase TrmD [Terrilactibacillus laevilacticus]|uniref:tRNA (guanosine(37)-N1)-methyltransferase TrmD n=1 Tax=Terrilactibacillus laevilacticus TaxID=1380157 RepID=UPI0011467321|nr:tRNA (guanosine(37)-N1)-methyltransferase TrmD [Terrilactibacillus laevilacticus]
MKVDILSLFPEMFSGVFQQSILKKASDKGLVDFEVTDFRKYTTNKHHKVDDYPYGGGAGMVLMPQPIFDAMDHLTQDLTQKPRVILMTPQGTTFKQKHAEELAQEDHLVFICGHYEGYDERIREALVTDEFSIGDFVLTGGELASMVMIDSIVRLLPGVLGNDDSAVTDSFSTGLLEHPQYTRPSDFRGMKVPEVLLSGNHALIDTWRRKESLYRTFHRRPDLLEGRTFTKEELAWLEEFKKIEEK